SLKSAEVLLPDIVSKFLVEHTREQRKFRDKTTAAKIARDRLRNALSQRFAHTTVQHLLMSRGEVEGKNKPHIFDAVVQNGAPHFAVDALSFELPKATNLDLLVY